MSYEGASQGVTVYLFDRWATGQGRDSLHNIENIIGSAHNDWLEGDDGQNFITGLGGHDVIIGHKGIDVLFGGEGNDHLVGGMDSDALFGDAGDDKLEGGDGDDFLDGGSGKDNLHGGSGSDQEINGENPGLLSRIVSFFGDIIEAIASVGVDLLKAVGRAIGGAFGSGISDEYDLINGQETNQPTNDLDNGNFPWPFNPTRPNTGTGTDTETDTHMKEFEKGLFY